jgi:hypothetical protein
MQGHMVQSLATDRTRWEKAFAVVASSGRNLLSAWSFTLVIKQVNLLAKRSLAQVVYIQGNNLQVLGESFRSICW